MTEKNKIELVPLRTFVATATKGTYDGAELRPIVGRPGATDALAIPSRMGNELRYRDGRVVRVTTEMNLAEQALGTGAAA